MSVVKYKGMVEDTAVKETQACNMRRRGQNSMKTLVFQGPVTGNEPGKTENWIEIRRHIFYHGTQGVKYFKKVGNVKCQILKMVTSYGALKSKRGGQTVNEHYCFKNYGLKERMFLFDFSF